LLLNDAGASYEKARSPNRVSSRGDEQLVVLAERSQWRRVCAALQQQSACP